MTMEINRLAMEYRNSGNQGVFTKLYGLLTELRKINVGALLRTGYADENDAQTVFDDTLLRALGRYNTGPFVNYLNVSLRNARIDFIRKQKRLRSCLISLETAHGDEEMTLGSRIPDDADTAADAIASFIDADRAEILDTLIGGTTDELTLSIIREFPQRGTRNAVAKALNVHHTVVGRKLRKLAREYDGGRYGEITDYIAV